MHKQKIDLQPQQNHNKMHPVCLAKSIIIGKIFKMIISLLPENANHISFEDFVVHPTKNQIQHCDTYLDRETLPLYTKMARFL